MLTFGNFGQTQNLIWRNGFFLQKWFFGQRFFRFLLFGTHFPARLYRRQFLTTENDEFDKKRNSWKAVIPKIK